MRDLTETLYAKIRDLIAQQLRNDPARLSISATDLAHDVWERARRSDDFAGLTEGKILAHAVTTARRILVERARSRRALKRGGRRPLELCVDVGADELPIDPVDVIALDDALNELATLDERQAKVVEMKFFGGLSAADIAKAHGVAQRTVERDWTIARAWLRRALSC